MKQCPKQRWTDDEIQILKRDYPNTEITMLPKKLKRTWKAIGLKALRLGIKHGSKGSNNPMWKGDKAVESSARQRAIRNIHVPKGYERHHKDGNPYNNEDSNLTVVTRREHMIIDGRLDRLISRNQSLESRQKASEVMLEQWGGAANSDLSEMWF